MIANTRPDDVFDRNLDWYYNERAGDLGLHAMPLEATIHGGDADQVTDAVLGSATRARLIHDALVVLSQKHRDALYVAHVYVSPKAHVSIQSAVRRWRESHIQDIRRAMRAFRDEHSIGSSWQAGKSARRRDRYLAEVGLRVAR